MSEQPKVAYGVEVIHDCIVRDTDVYRKFKSKEKKLALYREKRKILNKHPEVKKMIDPKFVRSLDKGRGKYVNKVAWIPTELVITDQRIREMCRNLFTIPEPYVKQTGVRFGSCPGLETLSACPMFSPHPKKTRAKLNKADIFIALQSRYFIDPPEILDWQEFIIRRLKREIEQIEGAGTVTATFGAGPCQLCHPNPCLGGGDCRAPKERLFALESVGVPVGQLCKDLAFFTGNDGWKIRWIKYFGTPRQTTKRYKSTLGLAVRLNGKKK
jgi:hypothetical protein